MQYFKKTLYLYFSHLLALGATFAQDYIELPAFTVTAQKRVQFIQDVPISVSRFDEELANVLSVTHMADLAALTPGLEIQEQSIRYPSITIRGIGSTGNEANVPPRISVFKDGVSNSRIDSASTELFDIERIEVLKGPQSTLFGQSAESGAIHIIQKKAEHFRSSALTAGVGSLDSHFTQGYFNTPLIADKLSLRVAGIIRSRDGYVENEGGPKLGSQETKAGRIAIAFTPTEAINVDLIANVQSDSPTATPFKSLIYPNANGDLDPFLATSLNDPERLTTERDLWNLSATVTAELAQNWELTTITSWHEFDSHDTQDQDGTLANFGNLFVTVSGEQLSQEVRFAYSGEKLKGFIGTSFFLEEGTQRIGIETDERSVFTSFAAQLPIVNDLGQPVVVAETNPFTGKPFNTRFSEGFNNYGKQRSFDLFADGSYDLSNRLNLGVGLRASREKLKADYWIENSPTPFFNGAPGFVLPASKGRISGTDRFNSITGRTSLTFKANDSTNLYVSINRGRRPNVINVTNDGYNILNEEILTSYELGLKGFSETRNLFYNLSLFKYNYSNFQSAVTELDDNGLFTQGVNDSGDATAYGVESNITYTFNRRFSVRASYAFLDAKFDDLDRDGNKQTHANNQLPRAPEHSTSMALILNQPTSWGKLKASLTHSWRSQIFFGEENLDKREQGAYGLSNLRIGLKTGKEEKWEYAIVVKNVFDVEYLINAGNAGEALGTPTTIRGRPRTWHLESTLRF